MICKKFGNSNQISGHVPEVWVASENPESDTKNCGEKHRVLNLKSHFCRYPTKKMMIFSYKQNISIPLLSPRILPWPKGASFSREQCMLGAFGRPLWLPFSGDPDMMLDTNTTIHHSWTRKNGRNSLTGQVGCLKLPEWGKQQISSWSIWRSRIIASLQSLN